MGGVVFINDLECFRAAGRKQKIVPADIVLRNGQHGPAPVRVENVAFGQVNPVRVIDAAAGGKPFAFVGAIERDEIGDLFAFRIDHAQLLAFGQLESGAALRFQALSHRSRNGGLKPPT